jgi:hypothetical protein
MEYSTGVKTSKKLKELGFRQREGEELSSITLSELVEFARKRVKQGDLHLEHLDMIGWRCGSCFVDKWGASKKNPAEAVASFVIDILKHKAGKIKHL